MKKPSKHSAAYVRRTIDHAWWTFTKAAQRYSEYSEAFDAECKAEKEHRAMGARWTKGQASYRLPAHYAAKLFVLQHTWEGVTGEAKLPTTWVDFNGFPRRCAVCYALGERLVRDDKVADAFGVAPPLSPVINSIDYAEDIAA